MKTRQILYAVAIGGLIGLFLCAVFLNASKAHADPLLKDDKVAINFCFEIGNKPNLNQVDISVMEIVSQGYGVMNHEVTNEMIYALDNYCPSMFPLVTQWANTKTSSNGSMEGTVA